MILSVFDKIVLVVFAFYLYYSFVEWLKTNSKR